MWRANIKNRTFDRMGEEWAPLIDPNHFLGRSAFDIPYPEHEKTPAASLRHEGTLPVLEILVPGYRKEELQVEVKNDLLFVKGSKTGSETTIKSEYVAREMQRDSFERIFKLAPSISKEGVEAKFVEGVLQISFLDVEETEERAIRKVKIL